MRFNIYKNGNRINTIISSEEFCKNYCESNQFTYSVVEDIKTKIDVDISREDDIDAILVDQEYRLTLLELGVNE